MYLNITTTSLRSAAEAIVFKIAPDKIFLLGVHEYWKQSNNSSSQTISPELITCYHLLILLSPDNKREEEELYKVVDKIKLPGTRVIAIIVPVSVFGQWLQKGHILAHNAWHTKRLIYDAGKTILSAPGAYDINLVYKNVQEETAHWIETAIHLKNSVEYFKKARQYQLGAFMLHQVAEQSLMAIVRLSTGYRAGTHNLWRLLRYAQVFSGLPLGMFNSSPGKEKALLRLLQSAYIGGRYKNDFELTEHQFLMLEEGIESLLNNIKNVVVKFQSGSTQTAE